MSLVLGGKGYRSNQSLIDLGSTCRPRVRRQSPMRCLRAS